MNNTGCYNSGNCNTGDRNTGDRNSGDCNSGNWNSGDCNSGNWNSGSWNSGDRNSGDCNSGNCNSGDCNSGNWNSGDWNSGNWNSGNWNSGDRNSGWFCTETPTTTFFDKPTEIEYTELTTIGGIRVLDYAPKSTAWVEKQDMTEEEKEQHPSYETTNGYLKVLTQEELKKERQEWYDGLSEEDKQVILDLPNFDAEKFEKCTLINVNANSKDEIKQKIAELEEEIKKLKEKI